MVTNSSSAECVRNVNTGNSWGNGRNRKRAGGSMSDQDLTASNVFSPPQPKKPIPSVSVSRSRQSLYQNPASNAMDAHLITLLERQLAFIQSGGGDLTQCAANLAQHIHSQEQLRLVQQALCAKLMQTKSSAHNSKPGTSRNSPSNAGQSPSGKPKLGSPAPAPTHLGLIYKTHEPLGGKSSTSHGFPSARTSMASGRPQQSPKPAHVSAVIDLTTNLNKPGSSMPGAPKLQPQKTAPSFVRGFPHAQRAVKTSSLMPSRYSQPHTGTSSSKNVTSSRIEQRENAIPYAVEPQRPHLYRPYDIPNKPSSASTVQMRAPGVSSHNRPEKAKKTINRPPRPHSGSEKSPIRLD